MKYLYPFGLVLFLSTTTQAQDWLASEKPKFLTDTARFITATVDTVADAPALAGFSAEMDKRYGFRGLRFETPVAQVKGLKLVGSRDGISIYEKIAENKILGNARLKAIQYCFYKGQLANIYITATGSTNAQEVVKVLMEAYGIPYSPQSDDENDLEEDRDYLWSGNTMTILLSVHAYEPDFTVLFSSMPMSDKQRRDKEMRVKQAAEKL